ncbi:fibronectin type III domain-containing protein 8 isoform 4-T4 [Liasis olivaceus]
MFQLYRNHTMLTSESSDTSSCGLSSTMESSKNILYSASSLPHTLDDLLAGMKVPEKEARQPPPSHSKCSARNESVLVNLDASDVETSASDSGSESPVCVELPPQPVIREHTVSTINAQVSWTGPQNDRRALGKPDSWHGVCDPCQGSQRGRRWEVESTLQVWHDTSSPRHAPGSISCYCHCTKA